MNQPPLISRRNALKSASALALAVSALEMAGPLAWAPQRADAATALPDIQFDIAALMTTPPQTSDTGVVFQMPPVHTVFVTARLQRTPTLADQTMLADALSQIETSYAFNATNILTFVSYGIPYFSRLPGGLTGSLVSSHMPRLASSTSRYVLEEAVPSPTDVSPANPGITKLRYNVPVAIESNDMLLTLRSDNPSFVSDVLAWLGGSNTLRGQAAASPGAARPAHLHLQPVHVRPDRPAAGGGAEKQPAVRQLHPAPVADVDGLRGPADQRRGARRHLHLRGQLVGQGHHRERRGLLRQRLDPAPVPRHPGHAPVLRHGHRDLGARQRRHVRGAGQYMFHAPNSVAGQHGPVHRRRRPGLPAEREQRDGLRGADRAGYRHQCRSGHGPDGAPDGSPVLPAASSRAADGTPIHIRMDGPGFDNMDVPGGSSQPKLQFTIFVPSADFFRSMRVNQASLDLQAQFGVDPSDNGLERFITATRRQNFLCPPRRHRAFPLVELS